MASRERKISIGKKQTSASSPVPPKEGVTPAEATKTTSPKTEAPQAEEAPKLPPLKSTKNITAKNVTAVAKKIRANATKSGLGKAIKINLKAKNKTRKITKLTTLRAATKNNPEVKKGLLKNGIKRTVKKTQKVLLNEAEIKKEPEDITEDTDDKNTDSGDKVSKKRVKKSTLVAETKKAKLEEADRPKRKYVRKNLKPEQSELKEKTQTELKDKTQAGEQKDKPQFESKEKPPTELNEESIEDVMNDLSFLIKDDVKPEPDSMSESGKSDMKVPTMKKITVRKTKALPKKKVKKEDIENSLSKINTSDSNVIDMLDLNVGIKKNKALPIRNRRRHSIEKFPISSLENTESVQTLFSTVPRSISPKSKRNSKVRQSIDAVSSRRSSPYTTRSDTPTRILRNGKHRKLKHANLLEGLVDTESKKRKRLCSEYSGSEVSKHSGYESDSSFSDMASLHGAELTDKDLMESKGSDVLKDDSQSIVMQEDGNAINTSQINVLAQFIKRTPSCDTALNGVPDGEDKLDNSGLIDTNSNLFSAPAKEEIDEKKSENDYTECVSVSPSSKVPEKSLILDIMKQTFNEGSLEEKEDKGKEKGKEKEVDREKEKDRKSMKGGKKSEIKKSLGTVTTAAFYGAGSSDPKEIDNKDVEEEADTKCEEVKTVESIEGDMETKEIEVCEEESPKDILVGPVEPAVIEEASEEKMEIVEGVQDDLQLNGVQNSETQNGEEIMDVATTNGDASTSEQKDESPVLDETDEERAIKEDMMHALGLQSKRAAAQAMAKKDEPKDEEKDVKDKEKKKDEEKEKEEKVPKNENYTGTLKTVIKLNRTEKKKGRPSLQKKGKGSKENKEAAHDSDKNEEEGGPSRSNAKESSSSNRKSTIDSSESAGAIRKSHYSNRSNMDASSEHTSDGDTGPTEEGAAKSLVIPEKASSFSIHPGRLCKDECAYCFGKFGLFDTPCHIATLKSVERQDKILAAEKHLQRDSCLCDACFRHVDRKSNAPSYANKSCKRNNLVAPTPKENHCHVLNCGKIAKNILRRKWIIKMRKSICQVMNIDLNNPGLHSIPVCEEHYQALEHLLVCAMCKRRLARNHVHYLGPELSELNVALNKMDIPVTLTDKPVVCKLCRYFASLAVRDPEELEENAEHFFIQYKKRLLHFHDVQHMGPEEMEEPLPAPIPLPVTFKDKDQLKRKKKSPKSSDETEPHPAQQTREDQSRVPSTESRPESPSDYMVDYNTLIPSINLECGSDVENSKRDPPKTVPLILKKISKLESVKEAVEISKNLKLKQKSEIAVQRLGSNPSISVRQLFPGEEELPLQGTIEFNNVLARTPEGWEKCLATIQYDNDTKLLWQELQKPYGNQSSFLRHLILLEKYFRNGDLILSPNASHHSVNYSESVQNRLRAYDNIPSNIPPSQPPTMVPFTTPSRSQKNLSQIISMNKEPTVSVSVTNAANIPKSTPITISQINNQTIIQQQPIKPKAPSLPPGLMPLQPGTNRPVAPLVKVPQSQKIKFPVTKNWRPNLIPIDPTKKLEKKPGLVQVISGGKPYHITVEDYKKMCAIKRTFDLRQKRLQEQKVQPHMAQQTGPQSFSGATGGTGSNITSPETITNKILNQAANSVLKSRKGLVISKTSTVTSLKPEVTATPMDVDSGDQTESILEKLDKQVEKLEVKANERVPSMLLPKIPKSLTVIPQSVPRKPSRPSSPVLMITQKPKSSSNKS